MAYGIDYISYGQFCLVTTKIKMSFDGKETKQNVLRSFRRSGKKFTREALLTHMQR